MATLVFILVGLLLAAVQTTVFMPGPLWPVAPDLYYVLVAYVACQFSLCRGIIILLPVSCVMDVYSGTLVGLYPAICCCGWLLLKFMTIKMPVRKPLYQLPLVAVSYLLISWLSSLLLDILQPEAGILWSWPPMLFRAGLVCLFSYPLFRCFDFLDSRLRGKFSFAGPKGAGTGNQFRQDNKLQ
ncbi:MAG: rod shape-determining protein MreD [Candidatus Electronema aureum]|uniref:Rod shape-determining protein MreD n=1 Tax=Candidatus Electronema aureum TaxID=2005002 RepID=A0A521G582_9BACT|nr:MAG: rod shape-determining protein MreD [Candidatus Electronema aureum]